MENLPSILADICTLPNTCLAELRVSNGKLPFPFRAAWCFQETEGSITIEHDFQLGKQGEDYHVPYTFPRKQEQRPNFKQFWTWQIRSITRNTGNKAECTGFCSSLQMVVPT
jgi:hypothetical protein